MQSIIGDFSYQIVKRLIDKLSTLIKNGMSVSMEQFDYYLGLGITSFSMCFRVSSILWYRNAKI